MTQTAKERHTTLKEKAKELHDERKRVLKEMGNAAKELFQEESKALFEKFPHLEEFSWTQYTPYWNDGDVCRFGVHNDEPNINGNSPDDLMEKDPASGHYEIPADSPDKWMEPCQNEVAEFLAQFTNDDYLSMFGDHVEVTVAKKGDKIEVNAENHRHD